MPTRMVTFQGSQGFPLAGRLDLPDAGPRAWALFAHCFTCSKDSRASAHVARALAEAGYGVLRFDFTGLGGSGGDFANTRFSSNVQDLVAAARWLEAGHGAPTLLVGHSLGGAAVLAAASEVPSARAVAVIGAPFDPSHVAHHFGGAVDRIQTEGEAVVDIGGRPFTVQRGFLEDLGAQDQAARIHALGRALLVLHAPRDRIVPVDNARRIFEAALHPKSFVSLDDADHLLDAPADARYAAGLIAAWAARFVPLAAASAVVGEHDGYVHVSERGTGNFAVAAGNGRHGWIADEPVAVGGDDSGPSPYELLVSALGACTAMTLRMYARQKGWPLEAVRVRLRHERVHATDCADCDRSGARVDRIERLVSIDGPLDADQRARLLEIADRCPVHRTLEGRIEVVTRAVD